jgi:hypothetical protein
MAVKKNSTIKDAKQALDWFQGRIRSAATMRATLLKAEESQRGSAVIGKMFLFKYDPKHKDKLPVYDVYPLVFPIERYSDGFLGLNIHYLSQIERAVFLGKLERYATATNLTEKSRLRLSYDLISSTKYISSESRPLIKRYLFSHIRSRFIEIPATEWDRAAALPIELFVTKK